VMLSHPFSTLCPGVRGGVLTVLAHTEKPLTGRTLASLTQPHASLRTVQTTLDDLVLNGVVLREHVGRAHSYTLNHSHLAAPRSPRAGQLASRACGPDPDRGIQLGGRVRGDLAVRIRRAR